VPTIDDFRKHAKDWLKEVRRQNPGPVKRLRLAYPKAPATPVLRDIQHALAREQGYEGWHALKCALERQNAPPARDGSDPRSVDGHLDRMARFLQFACWNDTVRGRGDYALRESAAARLLKNHPEIATDSLYTAVVCGNVDEVERRLAERPTLVNEKGGPWKWEPILYLCYGRLPLDDARNNAPVIARVLLDRGAEPNAYYMAGHALYGTLVGVVGEGEQEALPHPHREALYRQLLEHGAELYDIQVLYNTHFSGDMLWWLTLTYERAMKTGRSADWQDSAWSMLDMGGYGSGARFILDTAIEKNRIDLAEWALAHGADPNAGPPRARALKKTSLYDRATREHRLAIAELLVRYGAKRTIATLEGEDAFVAACLRLDGAAAMALVRQRPEYVQSPTTMFAAAARDDVDAIQLLLDLGTPVDVADEQRQRPLHIAAASDARRAAAHLIARGADVDARETRWGAPPIGYAAYHGHEAMVDLLSAVSRDAWHLAYHAKVERLAAVLAEEPALGAELSADGTTILWWLPNDEVKAVAVAGLLLAHGADPTLRAKDGTTAVDAARRRGLYGAADVIAAALRAHVRLGR
jgi:ankyrin repeat protein